MERQVYVLNIFNEIRSMDVFEAPPPHKTIIDDALPLTCTFETYRLVDRHIVRIIYTIDRHVDLGT